MRSPIPIMLMAVLCVIAVVVQAGDIEDNPLVVSLEKSVHFSASDGSDLVVAAGIYRVEPTGKTMLKLVPVGVGAEGESAKIILATAGQHEEPLNGSLALAFSEGEDEHHVVLLLPDGVSFDALGSYSGVRARVIRRLKPTAIRQQVRVRPSYHTLTRPIFVAPTTSESEPAEEQPVEGVDLTIEADAPYCANPNEIVGWWNCHVIVKNRGSSAVSFSETETVFIWDADDVRCEQAPSWRRQRAPAGGLYLPSMGTWSGRGGGRNVDSTERVTYICVDPDNIIAESDETNNTVELILPPVQTHPNSPPSTDPVLPDLVIESIAVSPSTGSPSTEFVVNVTIKNAGDADVPRYSNASIRHSLGGYRSLTDQVVPGGTKSFAMPLDHLLPPGTKTVTAEVDHSDVVQEKNETNNEKSTTFVVQ